MVCRNYGNEHRLTLLLYSGISTTTLHDFMTIRDSMHANLSTKSMIEEFTSDLKIY